MTTWDADSVTIHRGALPVSDTLKQIRVSALASLFDLFRSAQTDSEKNEVISALDAATRLPYQAQYSNELLTINLVNARQIVDFYIDISGSLSYQLLQHLEHRVL
ncbi:MAG: hypothetical protein H7240_00845 [Glaciimonas sp.]|nr:hypothetical protein [Glaciimonas sp.]